MNQTQLKEEGFLRCFPTELWNSFYTPNNKILVFSKSREKVVDYMNSLENVDNIMLSKDHINFSSNGFYYRWINLRDSSRGHRCGRAIVDVDLLDDFDLINNLLLPICLYCTKDTIEFIR